MLDLVSYALCKIAGTADFTGDVTIACLNGGIRRTIPPLPVDFDRKRRNELADMLRPILPQNTDGKIVEVVAHLNRGAYNPHHH